MVDRIRLEIVATTHEQAVGINLGTYSAFCMPQRELAPGNDSGREPQAVVPSVGLFDDQRPIVGQDALDLSRQCCEMVAQFIEIHIAPGSFRLMDGITRRGTCRR